MPDDAAARPAAIRQDMRAKERAVRLLWQMREAPGQARQECLYAILDAARDSRIYPGLRRLANTDQVLPLYRGAGATELAAVAPYLVCLGTTNRVFDWIWAERWGESWGIFVWSLVTAEALRAHFRRLTMVRTENGQRLLFRFYDPRVLLPFLQTCDAGQFSEMLGPMQCLMAETQEGAVLATFSRCCGASRSGHDLRDAAGAPGRSVESSDVPALKTPKELLLGGGKSEVSTAK
jgi:hypothetical protein